MDYTGNQIGLAQYFIPENCKLSIFEEEDKQTWIDCENKKMLVSMVIVGIIIIITVFVIILVQMSNSENKTAVTGIAGLLIVVLMGLSGVKLLITKKKASKEWTLMHQNIKDKMATGLSKSDAIKQIKQDLLKIREVQAAENQANAVARSAQIQYMNTGLNLIQSFKKK